MLMKQMQVYISTLSETTRKPNALLTSFAVGGTREILRYPRQSLDSYGYDYIEITAYDYVPSGLETGKSLKQGFKGSNRRFTRRYETIQLPMQPQLSESTAVSWGGDTLNAAQQQVQRAAFESIESFGGEGGFRGAINGIGDGLNDLVGLLKMIELNSNLSILCRSSSWCKCIRSCYRSSH